MTTNSPSITAFTLDSFVKTPHLPEEDNNITFVNWLIALGVFILICAVVTGNSCVILAVLCSKGVRRNLPTFPIINLAIADLLVGLLIIPKSALIYIIEYWPFDKVVCVITYHIEVGCCAASILFLSIIAMDRYIGVIHPLKYSKIMSRKLNICLATSVWIASFLMSTFPSLVRWNFRDENCNQEHELSQAFSCFLTACFLIWFLVVITIYWRIYTKLSKREKTILQNKVAIVGEIAIRIHVGGGGQKNDSEENNRNSSERKVAKMVGFVIGSFIICWFPYVTLLTVTALQVGIGCTRTHLHNIFIWFGYFNSCVNPFIYAANSKTIRTTLKKIFTKCKK